jgi:hypothetical protein
MFFLHLLEKKGKVEELKRKLMQKIGETEGRMSLIPS